MYYMYMTKIMSTIQVTPMTAIITVDSFKLHTMRDVCKFKAFATKVKQF